LGENPNKQGVMASDCHTKPTNHRGALQMSTTEIKEALEKLDEATTLIFNIEGARWQMAYDTLEALISNLKIESD